MASFARGAAVALMALLLVFLAAVPALAFSDVSSNDWFAPAVEELSGLGVVLGHADGTFAPYETVTRAEFAVLLARALGIPPGGDEPFTDVAAEDWYAPSVAALFTLGLVEGATETSFVPLEGLDREQAATLLRRAISYRLQQQPQEGLRVELGAEEVQDWLGAFRDRWLVSSVHREGVAALSRLGIVNGYTDGRFYPFFTLTRAQAAGLLHRAFYSPLVAASAPLPALEPESTYPAPESGSSGPLIAWLETKLAALSYQVGEVDGVYDERTGDAVMAFEKVEGLGRTGRAGQEFWEHVFGARAPRPRYDFAGSRVEVDLTRQVLFLFSEGSLVKTLPVSTGKDGWPTPTGRGEVFMKTPGWTNSAVGWMYSSSYIFPHIAIHGSGSVPPYPASHGCVRVSMWMADTIYELLPYGTRVDVYF